MSSGLTADTLLSSHLLTLMFVASRTHAPPPKKRQASGPSQPCHSHTSTPNNRAEPATHPTLPTPLPGEAVFWVCLLQQLILLIFGSSLSTLSIPSAPQHSTAEHARVTGVSNKCRQGFHGFLVCCWVLAAVSACPVAKWHNTPHHMTAQHGDRQPQLALLRAAGFHARHLADLAKAAASNPAGLMTACRLLMSAGPRVLLPIHLCTNPLPF